MVKYRLGEYSVPINIDYKEAVLVLKPQFGINLLGIFSEGNGANETLSALFLDDEKLLDLWWYYLTKTDDFDKDGDDFERALELLPEGGLDEFRDKFWEAVVNFSGPQRKEMMRDLYKTAQKEIRKHLKSALKNSNSVSSESPQDSE